MKSPTIVSPAASASRHDTVQAPLGTGVLIGIVTISPSASTSGLPVSWGCDGVPQASTTIGRSSLLSSWLNESTIAAGEVSSVAPLGGSIDCSELVSSWAAAVGAATSATMTANPPRRSVVSARLTPRDGVGRERSPELTQPP